MPASTSASAAPAPEGGGDGDGGDDAAAAGDRQLLLPADGVERLEGRSDAAWTHASCGSVRLAALQGAGGAAQKRRVFALMVFLGLANVYAMRMDLSVASESMQKRYGWTNVQQGYVLSSFFWGYVLFQIPGAVMARRWGGKHVFGVGVLGTSVLTLALPACASRLWLLYLVRALMGLCEAVTYPALYSLYTFWVPCTERAALISFTCAGAYFGTAAALPVAGAMVSLQDDADGVSTTWPLTFYVFGGIGILWFVAWECIVAGSPAEHSTITTDERKYIEATTREDADIVEQKVGVARSERVPWLGFLMHPAAWALHINMFASGLAGNTLMTYLPKYLDEELGFDMQSSGLIAALPCVLQGATAIATGRVSDHMTQSIPVRRVRLVMGLVRYAGAGSTLLLAGYVTHRGVAIAAVSLSMAFSGMFEGAMSPNVADLSPHYAGQFLSVTNIVNNLGGVLAPVVAGTILGDASPRSPGPGLPLAPVAVPEANWRHVFLVSVAVYAFAAVVWATMMEAKPVQRLN